MKKTITARVLEENERMDFLPTHFGRAMMRVENGVYDTMRKICTEYNGGYWDLVELSNDGAYMRLTREAPEGMKVSCENYYSGYMSPDAVSITACLYAINQAVWADPDNEQLNRKYYALRDYAIEHEESGKILAAID